MSYVWEWARENPGWAILIVVALIFAPVAVAEFLVQLVSALVGIVIEVGTAIFAA